jgi:SAM-dependent methyltransferase
MQIEPGKSWLTAMQNYERELVSIVEGYPDARILELGAGRYPSFRIAQMPPGIGSYTVNDIDQNELDLLSTDYERACFDVSGDASAFADRYDVVFSRFLAEHVRDGAAMHRNVHEVLKPGGVAFHLIPTLYASPFLLNKLLPERLTAPLLKLLTPRREISPKFPAYYSQCYGDIPRMRRMFSEIGYSRVEIREFYGHFYYEKIPGLRQLEQNFAALAARNGWSWCSSYAYITAHK